MSTASNPVPSHTVTFKVMRFPNIRSILISSHPICSHHIPCHVSSSHPEKPYIGCYIFDKCLSSSSSSCFPRILLQLLTQLQILLQLLLHHTHTHFCGPHSQIFLSRDWVLRTSLLLWRPYTNLPLRGQCSEDLATSMAPVHKSSSPMTGFSGPRYFYGPHTQIFLSRDSLFRTSVLRWPPYTNLPLPGQAFQDLATSMASIHKSSSPGTGFSGPRCFYGAHTQILLSGDSVLRTSLLLWPQYTNRPLP